MTLHPHAVILAAGTSRRFGSPKALARFGDHTLVELAISCARAVVGEGLTLVLGAHAEALRPSLPVSHTQITTHESWPEGLAASLRHGLSTVPAGAPAALILLVDQPAVSAADLSRLLAAWRVRPELAAAAEYANGIGAPCILPRSLFDAAMTLKGDRGAKALLQGLSELTRVPMPNAAFDVDTPADLAQLTDLAQLRDSGIVSQEPTP